MQAAESLFSGINVEDGGRFVSFRFCKNAKFARLFRFIMSGNLNRNIRSAVIYSVGMSINTPRRNMDAFAYKDIRASIEPGAAVPARVGLR